jgi:hypothetical protein
VFSDRDHIGTGNLGNISIANIGIQSAYLQNLDSAVNSSIQINVVGPDTGCDTKLEVLCLQEAY